MSRWRLIAILGSLLLLPLRAAPTTKISQVISLIKQHPADFRVQIICFDQDKQQSDHMVDVEATDDEGAAHSAEGLMLASQAAPIVDALADDGFFDRAVEIGKVQLKPPMQPFYVVQVHVRADQDWYEMRKADASLIELLVHIRDELGYSAAAKSADRAVAALNPQKRRWPVAADPASRPAPPMLASSDSVMHPRHAFVAIDPNWKVTETFLKPGRGAFLSSFSRIDADDSFPNFYRHLEYLTAADERLAKDVICYPDGQVFSEIDSFQYGGDLPRGDAYTRSFSPDGQVIYYSHVKDGKQVDAVSIGPDHQTLHVADGLGKVRRPTFEPAAYSMIWYVQGLVLVERAFDDAITSTKLNDNTEPGKAASLTITTDGSEVMYEGNFEWRKSAAGDVTRKALYAREEPSSLNPDQQRQVMVEQYHAVRQRFNERFVARAKSAGFSLRDLGVDSLILP